jgi:NADP-dependent 3-hydroxy acid dehydrogenase YdfG
MFRCRRPFDVVRDQAQIQEAADRVKSLDILINNAGVSVADELSDRSA